MTYGAVSTYLETNNEIFFGYLICFYFNIIFFYKGEIR